MLLYNSPFGAIYTIYRKCEFEPPNNMRNCSREFFVIRGVATKFEIFLEESQNNELVAALHG